MTMEENKSLLTEEEQAQARAVCNAKTPVSLLQELYVRRGMTPKYDLVQIEGAVHEPTFKYRVTVGEFVATGCGQSKKKAKHSAAKSILDKLVGAQNAGLAPPGQPVIPENVQDVFSPYDDGIDGNPVGVLQELCMSRRWPPPTYDLSEEEGLPHERSFIICCVIGKHRETGIGKSKKMAKRQAADKMIKRLQLIPTETDDSAHNIDEDDLAQGLVMRLSHQKESGGGGGRGNLQVHKFHKILQNVDGRGIQLLHNPERADDDREELSDDIEEIKQDEDIETDQELLEDSIKFLEFIAKEQKFEVTFVEVEEKTKLDRYQCMVQLSLTPVAVCFGAGETELGAKQSCAENALDYLKVMTKNSS
eukprot:TRINITY_DN9525_c0_g1_i1.p1 TRINITY_DN9525_c0_g1~~TRINITY_DN9525_c0_g1_i1.p1  ORF type:complete len:363 (+),score=95.44 TRINITY_DN9525_c0_g1_i1:44-1132(+)